MTTLQSCVDKINSGAVITNLDLGEEDPALWEQLTMQFTLRRSAGQGPMGDTLYFAKIPVNPQDTVVSVQHVRV